MMVKETYAHTPGEEQFRNKKHCCTVKVKKSFTTYWRYAKTSGGSIVKVVPLSNTTFKFSEPGITVPESSMLLRVNSQKVPLLNSNVTEEFNRKTTQYKCNRAIRVLFWKGDKGRILRKVLMP